jgi:hypothetical protein
MSNKTSQWYKEIGGDFGCIRPKGKPWVWYDCLLCARYQFPEIFKTQRWQGPPSKAILRGKANRVNRRLICFGGAYHNEILKNKKR